MRDPHAADRIEAPEGWTTLSHSQVDSFTQCPLKWYARYGARLSPVANNQRLAIGSAWHAIIERYRRERIAGADVDHAVGEARFVASNIRDVIPTLYADDDIDERLLWMLDGYVEAWRDEDDWEYLDAEVQVSLPLIPERKIWFVGYIDFVKRNRVTGRVVAGDTKTVKGKDVSKAYYSEDLAFEPQFARYTRALQLMGRDIDGFEWDAARVDRLKREMTLEERYARVTDWVNQDAADRAWSELLSIAEAVADTRDGLRSVYASPIAYVCKSRCDYFSAHKLATETGRTLEAAALDRGDFTQGEPKHTLDYETGLLVPVGAP